MHGATVILQGELPTEFACTYVEITAISEDQQKVPENPDIQKILDHFSVVFATPDGLPPRR